jgi:hypothetical protein
MKSQIRRLLPAFAWRTLRSAWYSILPYHRNGWLREFRKRRLCARILDLKPVRTEAAGLQPDAAICLMCCEQDWQQGLWTLKSFYRFSPKKPPLYILAQGAMRRGTLRRIQEHFPDAVIATQSAVDELAETALRQAGHERLDALRRKVIHLQKLTDFVLFCPAKRIAILDSDILFFRSPDEILEALERPGVTYFQKDAIDAYVLSPAEALAAFGVTLQPRLNVGMMVFDRELLDFPKIEKWLAHPVLAPYHGIPHIEQTFWAILACARGDVATFSGSYMLSMVESVDLSDAVARHYVSPVRRALFEEGMRHLERSGFLDR